MAEHDLRVAKTPDEAIVGEGFTLLEAGLLGDYTEVRPELPPWQPEELREPMQPYLTGQEMPMLSAGGGVLGVPPLVVQEQDGTPSVTGVDLVKVPNGTLTDLGGGDVSLNYESPINKNAANGYAGLDAGAKVAVAQLSEVLALADLSDVTAKSGTGATVVMQGSPTLTTPAIADLTNAQHGHQNAAGGGTLDAAAVASGTLPIARGGTGQAAKTEAFDALSPGSDLGDLIYHNGADNVRLAGNIATTRKFLRQVGNGFVSAAPAWDSLQDGDVPVAVKRGLFQARLKRDSATQVSIQDYQGNSIEINGEIVAVGAKTLITTANLITSTGGDAGAAMAASTLYYIYRSNNGVVNFMDQLRASATAPSLLNGVKYLGATGNATGWRFVGWVRTNGSTQFVDDVKQRFVINYYNRRPLKLFTCPGYVDNNANNTWTTTSGTWVRANGSSGDTLEWIGNGEDAVHISAFSFCANNGQNYNYIGIALDATTSVKSNSGTKVSIASEVYPLAASFNDNDPLTEGYHIGYLMARVSNGTGTFYADNGRGGATADTYATYICALVMG